jgi:hypothetical protein
MKMRMMGWLNIPRELIYALYVLLIEIVEVVTTSMPKLSATENQNIEYSKDSAEPQNMPRQAVALR